MRLLVLALALLALPACAQTTDAPPARADSVVVPGAPEADVSAPLAGSVSTTALDVRLGGGVVAVRVHTAPIPDALGSPGFETFPLNALNLHDDESTSVEAALDVLRETGGRLVELVHTGERNVTFEAAGETYRADPNRMFTAAGRQRTLAALSSAAPEARAALEAFADSVLAVYSAVPPAVVITLHNNTDAHYSARSYASGGEYAAEAEAVAIQAGADPDDFFFVTDRALYDALAARGFNAVLQDNDAATDDGSLSVWAAQNGRPYVNVEAEHGHRAEQARMIRALVDVLSVPPTE